MTPQQQAVLNTFFSPGEGYLAQAQEQDGGLGGGGGGGASGELRHGQPADAEPVVGIGALCPLLSDEGYHHLEHEQNSFFAQLMSTAAPSSQLAALADSGCGISSEMVSLSTSPTAFLDPLPHSVLACDPLVLNASPASSLASPATVRAKGVWVYPPGDNDVDERLAPGGGDSAMATSAAWSASQQRMLGALHCTLHELRKRHGEFLARLRNTLCEQIELRPLLRGQVHVFEQQITREFVQARERVIGHSEQVLSELAQRDAEVRRDLDDAAGDGNDDDDEEGEAGGDAAPASTSFLLTAAAAATGVSAPGTDAPAARTAALDSSKHRRGDDTKHESRGIRGGSSGDSSDSSSSSDNNQSDSDYDSGASRSSSSNNSGRSGGLPQDATTYLKLWLLEHFENPYPSEQEKHQLMRETGLSYSQLNNWFINARVRLWKPAVKALSAA